MKVIFATTILAALSAGVLAHARAAENSTVSVTAMQMALDYERNSQSADTKYRGKIIEVRGIVKSTGSAPAKGVFIKLLGTSTYSGFVKAWISGEYSTVTSISPNDEINLKCRAEGISNDEVTLYCDPPIPKIANDLRVKQQPTRQQICIADASLMQKIANARDYGVRVADIREAIAQDLAKEADFSPAFRQTYPQQITYLYSHPWVTPEMAREGHYNQCMLVR